MIGFQTGGKKMNERTKSIVTTVLALIFFIICVALVVIGQKNVGVQGLMVMLVGLVGLLFLLYCYNKKFK